MATGIYKRKPHSEETKRKISEAKKQQWVSGKMKSGWKNSPETIEKRVSQFRGEKHWNWRGGITKWLESVRKTHAYKNWRKEVFERDKYTCQECGQVGGELQADHIKPKKLFPELIFDINNGRTLCSECHRKTDTYGVKLFLNKING